MQDAENIIKVFTTRVRQLILRIGELKKDNAELCSKIEQRDEKIHTLEKDIERLKKEYDSMMMAKILNITDGSLDETKRRINRLITSVDRCLMLVKS